jgi:glycosyltransferase involved in cell wall biosynthesis
MANAMAGTETRAQRAAESDSLPRVAVVVPTYNRAASLAETLGDLAGQDYPRDRLAIVVVDDGSTDGTAAAVRAAQAGCPFPLAVVRQGRGGIPAARNRGIAASGGEVVGFTDSDCHVGPDWVRRAVGHMGPGVGLVVGPIRPVVHARRRPGFFQHQLPPVEREDPLYPGANMFYRRAVLERLGGFDERIGRRWGGPPVQGDDTLLAWRAKRAGVGVAFAADAPVEHEASAVSVKGWLLEPLRVAIYPRLVAHVPELREHYLFWRLFLGRGDPLFLLAIIGAILALTRSRPLLLLAVPWCWLLRGHIAADVWPPWRWWRIPLKYALFGERFGLVMLTLLYASVRDRTVVL